MSILLLIVLVLLKSFVDHVISCLGGVSFEDENKFAFVSVKSVAVLKVVDLVAVMKLELCRVHFDLPSIVTVVETVPETSIPGAKDAFTVVDFSFDVVDDWKASVEG